MSDTTTAIYSAETTERAYAAAQTILDSLADPTRVRFSTAKPPLRTRPASLGGGAAGVALAHTAAARTGQRAWAPARAWIARALSEPVNGGDTATLWSGAPSLGMVTAAAATSPTHLDKAREHLHKPIVRLTQRRLDQAHARIDRGRRPPQAEFDLIQGLAGLSVYHLYARPDANITRQVLTYLVRLTLPLPGDSEKLPGWWTEQSPRGILDPGFPGGHLNLGMAHGISATLSVLSRALHRGIAVDGQAAAIERICAVLDAWRHTTPTGSGWPYYLTPARWRVGPRHATAAAGQRPSWCYGTPGIARAQQLAGIALADPHRQAVAVQAMADCLRDRPQLRTLTGTGLCHGWAGLLHCTWRINADAPGAPLTRDLARIATALLERWDRDKHHAPDPEFLDGHAGIALALHTYATGTAPEPPWDACLALA